MFLKYIFNKFTKSGVLCMYERETPEDRPRQSGKDKRSLLEFPLASQSLFQIEVVTSLPVQF